MALVADPCYHKSVAVKIHQKVVDFRHNFFVHLILFAGYTHPAVVRILPAADYTPVGHRSHHVVGCSLFFAVHSFLADYTHPAVQNSPV